MQITVRVSLEHGVMFLYDPYAEVEIPPDTGAAPITVTHTCLCFRVAPYVDSEAHVTLSDEPFDPNIKATFAADLSVPNKYIALSDSQINYYGSLRVLNDVAKVFLWNYEEEDMEKTWIQVANLAIF
jgi:hypothetical protein